MASIVPARNGIGDRAAPDNYTITEVRFRVLRDGVPTRVFLDSPATVARFARELFPDDGREHFWTLLMDVKNQLVAVHHVSTGTLTGTLVTAREVCGPALRLLGVARIVLVHNHPSGDPEPSPEDMRITAGLIEGARLLDLEIIDHLILGDGTDRAVSFVERGLI